MNSAPKAALPMPLRLWLFWLPFLLGSGALVFGLVLAQVPGKERTFDVVVLSSATALLAGALWLGFFHSNAPFRRTSGWTEVVRRLTVLELLLAAYGTVGALTYRGL